MVRQQILRSVRNSLEAIGQLNTPASLTFMEKASEMMVETFARGHKLLIAGNGGSLCEAMHFAEELTGQFRRRRPALPAIALSDPGHLSCVGNDFGFDSIFSRGVEALGQPHDLLVGLSTSGNSKNILRAFQAAKEVNMRTIALLGKTGGAAKGVANLELVIKGDTADRIQEAHLTVMHILIELVENTLYPVDPQLKLHEEPATAG